MFPCHRQLTYLVFGLCNVLLLISLSCQRAFSSEYILPRTAQAYSVIVFVHGLTGNARDTWASGRGGYWPERIRSDPFYDAYDVFVYDYPSTYFSNSFTIGEVARDLDSIYHTEGLDKYYDLIFVGHSFGGNVIRAFLNLSLDVSSKTRLIYFFGTPSTGLQIANLASMFKKVVGLTPQLGQLRLLNRTNPTELDVTYNDWQARNATIPSYCAYETKMTFGLVLVDMASATALCNRRTNAINANHIQMVKPDGLLNDTAYRLLTEALMKEHPPLVNGSGWIWAGYWDQIDSRWIGNGPHVQIVKKGFYSDRSRPIETGDIIQTLKPLRVHIVDFAWAGPDNYKRSPIAGENSQDPPWVPDSNSFTGVQLPPHSILEVRDSDMQRAPGKRARSVWLRVAYSP